MNIQDLVDKHYDQMFEELIKVAGDNFYDLKIEIIDLDGLTVRRSWKERDDRLLESNDKSY